MFIHSSERDFGPKLTAALRKALRAEADKIARQPDGLKKEFEMTLLLHGGTHCLGERLYGWEPDSETFTDNPVYQRGHALALAIPLG